VPQRTTVPGVTLDVSGSKGRYGVAYLRSICSQAGITMTETEPGEDVLAVDCDVHFQEASVRVQVKCTSQWRMAGKSLAYPVEDGWVRKWDAMVVPVYFVVVIVPPDPAEWLRHRDDGTFHSTAAFWTRLMPGQIGTTVRVPKNQRLYMETIDTWHDHLLAAFTPTGKP